MIESEQTDVTPPATDADGNLLLSADEVRDILRECFAGLMSGLQTLVRMSIETTNDLFEMNEFVSEADAQDFRLKRDEWIAHFERALRELFEKRLAGTKRQGRRPDFDASIATLRVLNSFDQEKQAALIQGAATLQRITKRELDALDLRVGVLLREQLVRDIDNPLAPAYVLDAVGVASRAVYPNPRIWRPLMERVIDDATPGMNTIYIKINRFLAGRQVLPEIKAELRARSELRPADDSDLLPAFMRLFKEAAPAGADALLALNVNVPSASPPGAAGSISAAGASVAMPVSAPLSGAPPEQAAAPAPGSLASPMHATASGSSVAPALAWSVAANPYVIDLAQPHASAATVPATSVHGLPQLDPLMALGSLSAAVAALDRWQRADPGIEFASSGATQRQDAAVIPLNRIPYIRAAIADKLVNSTDKITMDVIGLLFDYIFRDPSIPESLRGLFSRLQVPILKTALLDRTFFSDKKHPARHLLDHLAAAAIGATSDAGYRAAFELVASGVIDEVCRDFRVDVAVFDGADAKLQEFVEGEQRKLAAALGTEVAGVFAQEEGEADRSHVREFIRDKLAGVRIPFDVRSFSETTWADYLTLVRTQDGTDSEAWHVAVRTLDDLLWSITSKERTAQKARLAKLVPTMIRNLRAGAAAVQVGDERVRPFLDVMYKLHMAAIKPKGDAQAPMPAQGAAAQKQEARVLPPAAADLAEDELALGMPSIINVHDFVSEMVVGTWLAFEHAGKGVNARLSWISPLRSKYIFTSRARTKAIVVTPEELAWQLGAGKTRLIVEPVPLFDRAVSAALDSIATRKPPAAGSAAAA